VSVWRSLEIKEFVVIVVQKPDVENCDFIGS
jgi:hypothetical protein